MEEKYIFNERLSRLEPTETKCLYCRKKEIKNLNSCHFLNLYNEKKRTNVIVYRSVKFSKILIGVPRCESCKSIHEKSSEKANNYLIVIGITLIALAIIIFSFSAIFISILIIAVLLLSKIPLKNKFIRDQNILIELEGAKKVDLIMDFIIDGWSFTQPSA